MAALPIAGSRLSEGLLAVGLALGGCTQLPPQALSPVATAASLEARSLRDPRLLDFLRASGAGDPTAPWGLRRLTLAALYFHPDLAVAHATLAGAEADIVIARQHPNPTLNLGAGIDTAAASGAIPGGALPLTVGPLIDFVIETFGKRADRTAQAASLAAAARADLAQAAWLVRGRLRGALLNDWAAGRRADLARELAGLHRTLVELLEQRVAAGEGTGPQLISERVALVEATLGVAEAERQAAGARAHLAAALGIPVEALRGVTLSYAAFEARPAADTDRLARQGRSRALTGRDDIRAGLARYEAAQAALRLQMASRYPNLTLGPGYEYDAGLNRFSLSPSVELPIFNQNQGPIARALADRQLAAARFIALQAQIIGELDAAEAEYRVTTATLGTADALADEEWHDLRQAQALFAAGQSDRPALVAAQLEAALARAAQFDAVVRQRQAVGALEDALQLPLLDAPSPDTLATEATP